MNKTEYLSIYLIPYHTEVVSRTLKIVKKILVKVEDKIALSHMQNLPAQHLRELVFHVTKQLQWRRDFYNVLSSRT